MKLQQLVFRVEELKALTTIFEQNLQAFAQATALEATLPAAEVDEETRKRVDDSLQTLRTRHDMIIAMLQERTGTDDVDAATQRVEEHVARLQQFFKIRGEQLQLRAQLETELAIGAVTQEARHEVEGMLAAMQTQLEAIVQLGEQALRGPKLISLA